MSRPTSQSTEQSLSRALLRPIFANWWFYLALGATMPVLPRYVEGPLGGTSVSIGGAMLAYSVAAVVVRPLAGRLLQEANPWRLIRASVLIASLSIACLATADSTVGAIMLRAMSGLAEGCFYTGSALVVVRRAAPSHRARAISYFSVAMFTGLAIGPVVGEGLAEVYGYEVMWLLTGGMALVALIACVRDDVPVTGPDALGGRVAWRPVLSPWLMVVFSMLAYAALQSFVPVFAPTVGLSRTGPVFCVYALTVLVLRLALAPIADRLDATLLAQLASVAYAGGALSLAAIPSPVGIYVCAEAMAVAVAIQFPAIMRLCLRDQPSSAQASVIAAVGAAYEVGAGAGAMFLGIVSDATTYRLAFAIVSLFPLAGLALGGARFFGHGHQQARGDLSA